MKGRRTHPGDELLTRTHVPTNVFSRKFHQRAKHWPRQAFTSLHWPRGRPRTIPQRAAAAAAPTPPVARALRPQHFTYQNLHSSQIAFADPQGPQSTQNQQNSQNGGRQETIGHCLIRQWPILLDAFMVGFWLFSLTVLPTFPSPSVSPLPPPPPPGGGRNCSFCFEIPPGPHRGPGPTRGRARYSVWEDGPPPAPPDVNVGRRGGPRLRSTSAPAAHTGPLSMQH